MLPTLRADLGMIGPLAHSPQICNPDQIPHDQYDEWLVFDHAAQVEQFESMVNSGGFTPIDFAWDEKRERFWEQVIRLRPLHVLAENQGVYQGCRTRLLQAMARRQSCSI